jgi:hypothetical protein
MQRRSVHGAVKCSANNACHVDGKKLINCRCRRASGMQSSNSFMFVCALCNDVAGGLVSDCAGCF